MTKQLINIFPQKIGNEKTNTVSARDLHAFLEVKTKFAEWIKRRIEDYGYQIGVDYVIPKFGKNGHNSNLSNGAPLKEYYFSIDMAKELCMLENNAKGHEARKYFIECERIAHSVFKQLPRISDEEYNQSHHELCEKLNNKDKIIMSHKTICEELHGLTPKEICKETGVRTARGSADDLARSARKAIEAMVALSPEKDIVKTVKNATKMVLDLLNVNEKLPYVATEPFVTPRLPRAKLTIQLELF